MYDIRYEFPLGEPGLKGDIPTVLRVFLSHVFLNMLRVLFESDMRTELYAYLSLNTSYSAPSIYYLFRPPLLYYLALNQLA
jgi:hypothetical protein